MIDIPYLLGRQWIQKHKKEWFTDCIVWSCVITIRPNDKVAWHSIFFWLFVSLGYSVPPWHNPKSPCTVRIWPCRPLGMWHSDLPGELYYVMGTTSSFWFWGGNLVWWSMLFFYGLSFVQYLQSNWIRYTPTGALTKEQAAGTKNNGVSETCVIRTPVALLKRVQVQKCPRLLFALLSDSNQLIKH